MSSSGRLRSALIARAYRDVGGAEAAMVVSGMARSGTTWLAELVCAESACRLIFEPFHNGRVREYARFEYHQYVRPGAPAPELAAFSDRLLRGEVRGPWVDRQAAHLRPRCRLVKAVRGSLLLGWLRARYPELPIVCLVRHPCANVASFMRLGWSSDEDLASILRQNDLIDDHLVDRLEITRRATLPHQRHAVLWSILNSVPLRQFHEGGAHFVHYEALVERPHDTMPALFEALGRSFDSSLYDRLERASRTARRGRASAQGTEGDDPDWKKRLGPAAADDVLEIVHGFGLGDLYDDQGRPGRRLPGAS